MAGGKALPFAPNPLPPAILSDSRFRWRYIPEMTTSDLDLLWEYTRGNSEEAFAELVNRHLNLVYSAALRQVKSPQLAEEVAQSAFTDLARNAHRLASDTILTAWLYQVSHRTAIDVIRRDSRRQLREQIATEMNDMNATAADWTHIAPVLDEAMQALDDTDRAAVLLRYFENKSLREVGATLGTSDDAAQKRVSRAVERLREFFTKRGITVGAGGLAIVLSANAVQAAPAGLNAAITTSAALAAKTVVATTTATATKAIAMTILQKTLITAVIVATLAAGTGAYVAHRRAAHPFGLESKTNLPKDSWADTGFASPQAALRTRGWAVLNGNHERFKESLFITAGARTMMEEMIAGAPFSDADKKLHPELLSMGVEDGLLLPMMAQNKQKGFTGYRILSQQLLPTGDLRLQVETGLASAPAKTDSLTFRREGNDWKVVIDEEMLKGDYQKFLNFTKSRHQ